MPRGTPTQDAGSYDNTITTGVDLNSTGTTDVYDAGQQAIVYGAYLPNGGTSAIVQLEITDGTDTAVLTPGQAAGDGIAYTGPIVLNKGWKLQVNVTTVEGAAQTNDAVVSHSEQ